MSRIAAVFAHFDVDRIVDANTLAVLNALSRICDIVEFVTTSDIDLDRIAFPPGVNASRRPNIGYDFYSYKTGLLKLLADPDVTHVFIVNSSFMLLDPEKFEAALAEMVRKAKNSDVVGGSASTQMGWHIQSYLMLLGPAILRSNWFLSYVNAIQPQNSKIDLICNYEIGLSQRLQENAASTAVLFDVASASARGHITGAETAEQANPVHARARDLAEQIGIVKTEVLRDNQHGIDLGFVEDLADDTCRSRIDAQVNRLREHYAVGADRMTAIKTEANGPPAFRLVSWHSPHQPGVHVAVVIHMFYPELSEEFCTYLQNIVVPFDVFLTTPFEHDVPDLINRFSALANSVSVAVCENRGRDIGPFVSLYRSGELDGYDAVLKLHSKKSKYSALGDQWRRDLLGALLGTSLKALRSIDMVSHDGVGIVGQHEGYLTNPSFWGANKPLVDAMMARMGLDVCAEGTELGFFAGSMFWFRPEALIPLKRLTDNDLDFETENGVQDGSLAHAIERSFCVIARSVGFRSTTIYLSGQEIHDTSTATNRVPVL